jgi:ornithine cyclodeaminase/alanine dehydrogenase-like protein (mu-crystallin family)
LGDWLRDAHGLHADIADGLEPAIRDASLVIFTTTASAPYVADEALFAHAPTVLHLSLRDIGENLILGSQNIVDDVDHCLKANTSLHLAEQKVGNRDFILGNLVEVMDGKVAFDQEGARIFSPFGLGVLDIALGDLVLDAAIDSGEAIAIADFFSSSARW